MHNYISNTPMQNLTKALPTTFTINSRLHCGAIRLATELSQRLLAEHPKVTHVIVDTDALLYDRNDPNPHVSYDFDAEARYSSDPNNFVIGEGTLYVALDFDHVARVYRMPSLAAGRAGDITINIVGPDEELPQSSEAQLVIDHFNHQAGDECADQLVSFGNFIYPLELRVYQQA